MKRHLLFMYLLACLLVGVTMLASSCGGSSVPKEKTAAQRAEDYHKNLTTDDLSFFELKGNVKSVAYPEGFLRQFDMVPVSHAECDSLCFSATGLCESLLAYGGDSLQTVRNTVGAIAGFSTVNGKAIVSVERNADGQVIGWAIGDARYALSYANGMLSGVTLSVGGKARVSANIKVLATDNLGNWTTRQLSVEDKTPIVQHRHIRYY